MGTDEIYNTIIEKHNMRQVKINDTLGIVQQLVKDNVKKPNTYEKAHHQHQLMKAIQAIGVRKEKLTWRD